MDAPDELKKFSFKADAIIIAENLDDAMLQIALHFLDIIRRGDTSEIYLLGFAEISPLQESKG